MKGYAVRPICRQEAAAGFALAGLRPVVVFSADEACEQLEAACRTPEVGVVLLEDAFYQTLPDRLSALLLRLPLPIVVPFPGPTWVRRPDEAEQYVVELLRRVIGYRVRLK
ncbi:MAG: hypothetical protein KatS3mg081_2936 [Gemmatimonadales bacterium]|nr:MAG: hypothetical protein KatS3mg081_2936 [Gemmatimonadales bacterium]